MNKSILKAAAIVGYITAALTILSVVVLDIFAIVVQNLDLSGLTIEEHEAMIVLITFLAVFLTIISIPILIATFIGSNKFLTYSKLGDEELATKQNSVIGWSIFFILTNFIIGVLGFIAVFTGNKNKPFSLENRLKELQNLYDKGIISKEEYQERRSALITKAP